MSASHYGRNIGKLDIYVNYYITISGELMSWSSLKESFTSHNLFFLMTVNIEYRLKDSMPVKIA